MPCHFWRVRVFSRQTILALVNTNQHADILNSFSWIFFFHRLLLKDIKWFYSGWFSELWSFFSSAIHILQTELNGFIVPLKGLKTFVLILTFVLGNLSFSLLFRTILASSFHRRYTIYKIYEISSNCNALVFALDNTITRTFLNVTSALTLLSFSHTKLILSLRILHQIYEHF